MKYKPGKTLGEFVDQCVLDALERMEKLTDEVKDIPNHFQHVRDDYSVYTYPSSWGSTACGFSGVGGHAITTTDTIVVVSDIMNMACVYHGRFAYMVRDPNGQFFSDIANCSLVGAKGQWTTRYRRG